MFLHQVINVDIRSRMLQLRMTHPADKGAIHNSIFFLVRHHIWYKIETEYTNKVILNVIIIEINHQLSIV
jgi:hypothetical protein